MTSSSGKRMKTMDNPTLFGEQLLGRNWGKLATYPAPANIALVKEFYTNARKIGDYPTEDYLGYVRGHAIRIGDTLCQHLPERVLRQFGFQQSILRELLVVADANIVVIGDA
ncbi:hypothetical protein LR48_Vigan11g062300 [Vigna angularis]|uniref:Putative plant transposon protein domain-containing protein n=1 Tax=Phaseolus angularis TaxID=3914 RepID=A0A0L9VR97_PHAAN|nr:hypothetical protein LR48_Vigan11g062300 [Vigna angularis]